MKQKNFPQNIAEVVLGKKVKSCTRSCLLKCWLLMSESHILVVPRKFFRAPTTLMRTLVCTGLQTTVLLSATLIVVLDFYIFMYRVKVDVPDE